MPTVRALRPFMNEHHSHIVQPGDVIAVTADRARALTEGGLVEAYVEAKATPAPANKMAPVPVNKASPGPARRLGRPPKGGRR